MDSVYGRKKVTIGDIIGVRGVLLPPTPASRNRNGYWYRYGYGFEKGYVVLKNAD